MCAGRTKNIVIKMKNCYVKSAISYCDNCKKVACTGHTTEVYWNVVKNPA
jgi:hypothetical protein